ncbi:extracellular solute-binding protein family 5 (plasmid) [Ketogulonicigenium vulgare Y25]|uniref:Putative ABC-type dipeptide transport system, periplasmic component n=1 Tax=Ketogulonicigenium vulgare (strain WSH-001) TaxID=759362 RepID=F9YBT6_KETVW|nr:ABC transporter substrate-binding protein [Ketogulonicigenium vulgare]ADO44404.1 extracellular solute-binding protein family 5 [Ketogulonicigenium vulgare Y25]AEM42838.1 putative ABC-type dipeptide transport system, periplasmic component [Ketogulonicigenium vulgare WSH-001]ALJ82872.1 peptide ABC transporter substrate-binding protein [Ketogulonicigenium vulgare]
MRLSLISRRSLMVAALLLGTTALVACKTEDTASADENRTITVGVQRPPNSYDPLLSVWGGQYQMYLLPVYEPLIRQNTDGTYGPALAVEFGYSDEARREYTLTLREGVVFSDGTTPVTADAVKQNLDRLLTVSGPQTRELSDSLAGVTAPDARTVVISLNQANPDLERIISQLSGMIVNPAALAEGSDLATNPAGAGPYVLDAANTIVNDTYVYTKNPHYYDPDAYPYATITMKVYGDQNAMLTALQSGVAQLGYGGPDNVEVARRAGLQVAEQPTNVFHIVLHDRDGALAPALADQRVRQALNFAVDREAILASVYRGEGALTTQIFGPNTEAYDAALNDLYPYDPDRARALLRDAGYPDGFTFSVAMFFPQRDGDYAQAIAAYLAEIGVTMQINSLAGTTSDPSIMRQNGGFVNGFGGQGAFTDSKTLFLSPGTIFNAFGSVDPELNALWEAAANQTSDAARQQGFRDLGRAVVEKAWFLPTTVVNAVAYYREDALSDVTFTPGVTVPLFYELRNKAE